VILLKLQSAAFAIKPVRHIVILPIHCQSKYDIWSANDFVFWYNYWRADKHMWYDVSL